MDNLRKGAEIAKKHGAQICDLYRLVKPNITPAWRKKGGSPGAFNHLRSFLVSVYSTPLGAAAYPANPVKAIPRAKLRRTQVAIATNDETNTFLRRAWTELGHGPVAGDRVLCGDAAGFRT